MAHFVRTRVNLAAWAVGTEVTNVEYDDLDGKTFAAVNGDAGGTWAPAAAIIIGGSGVEFTGNVNFSGAAALQGDADLNGDFQVNDGGGDLLVFSDVTFGDNPGSTITIGNGANLTSINVTAASQIRLANGATITTDGVGGTLTMGVGSTTTLTSTLILNGPTQTLGTVLTSSGEGRLSKRVVLDADIGGGVPGHDANNIYSTGAGGGAVGVGDVILIENGQLSVGHAYTLAVAGASKGDIIEFANNDVNWPVSIDATVSLQYAAGFHTSARFVFNGANWRIIGACPFTP